MIHLKFMFGQIGDQVSLSGIPENIHNIFGEKCVISEERIWAFKHNPYVIHMSEEEAKSIDKTITLCPDTRNAKLNMIYANKTKRTTITSQNDYIMQTLFEHTALLRHPRLYVYENEKINPNQIIVHTTGTDRKAKFNEDPIRTNAGEDAVRVMSDKTLDAIRENYKHYKIIQIGAESDKPLGGNNTKDFRGKTTIWETARLIASSAVFIGVNSGPMHIANCYPRTTKKIVLEEFPEKSLQTWRPGDLHNYLFSWLDPNNNYYNKFETDIGFTNSYTKL